MNKRFTVTLYAKDGVFLKSIKENQVRRLPDIKTNINLGAGRATIDFNVDFDSFFLELSLDFMVRVEVKEFDLNNVDGRLVFSGFVSRIKPILKKADNYVEVTCHGYGALLNRSIYRDSSGNTINYTNAEPKNILENIITDFNSKYFDSIVWDSSLVETVGTGITVNFEGDTWQKSIERVRELSGGGFYWYIDNERKFHFRSKPETPTHTFKLQKNIESLTNEKSAEKVINSVRVYYGDLTVFESYEDLSSGFGEVFRRISDSEIGDSVTALQRAKSEVEDKKDPKVTGVFLVNNTYDIESIRVGDTCQILGTKIGSQLFSENMQIVSITYQQTKAKITLEQVQDDLGLAISELTN